MDKHKKSQQTFEESTPTWTDALVLVCEKCCDKKDVSAKDLRKDIKSQFKEQGLGHQIRVVSTSCLGICPKNQISMAVASSHTPLTFRAVLLPPDPDATSVVSLIQQHLRGS